MEDGLFIIKEISLGEGVEIALILPLGVSHGMVRWKYYRKEVTTQPSRF